MNHDSELLSKAIAHHCAQAFSQASANTAHGQIPSGLLSALIRQGILTSEEGLQRVEYVQHAHRRINRLLAIIPLLSPEQLPRAVAIARGFRNSNQRMLALGALLERMPELWDEFCQAKPGAGERRFYNQLWRLPDYLPDRFVPQMMVLAGEFHCSKDRNYFWQQLLPRLSAPLLQEYLIRVRQEEDVAARTRLLSAIAQSLPSVWPEVLDSLSSLPNNDQKHSALSEIASALSQTESAKALEIAKNFITAGFYRVEALLALIPRLSEAELSRSEAIARNLSSPVDQAQVLGAIAARRSNLWPEVWNLIEQIEENPKFSKALNRIAEQLPDAYFSKMVEAVTRVEYPFNRFEILVKLAPKHPELWPQVLAIPPQLDMEYLRSDALIEMVRVAPESILGDILRMTEILHSDQFQVIDRLAPHLSKPVLQDALAMTQQFGDEDEQAIALAGLAKYQPSLWSEVWKVCASIAKEPSRTHVLLQLLADLPEAQIPQYLEIVETLQDGYEQLRVLCELVPTRLERLDKVLDKAHAMPANVRVHFLCSLAPYRPELWDEVLSLAKAITVPEQRIRLLIRVAQARPEGWPEILHMIQHKDAPERIKLNLLRYLAPRLPEVLLMEGVKIAMAFPDPQMRIAAVCPFAHRQPELAIEIIEQLSAQTFSTSTKLYALRWLAPVLPEERLAQAFSLCKSIDPTKIQERFDALCHLAPRQPVLWEEALTIAHQSESCSPSFYNSIVMRLVENFPDVWIPELHSLVESIQDPVRRATVLSVVLPRLELMEIGMEEFERLMEILAGGDRKTYLKSLPLMAPAILKLGGEKALNAISDRLKQNFNAAKYHPA